MNLYLSNEKKNAELSNQKWTFMENILLQYAEISANRKHERVLSENKISKYCISLFKCLIISKMVNTDINNSIFLTSYSSYFFI